ncbi:MAG TPA: cytochrome c3 family protein, partial [Terriglobales bacterium]|nr:cytochrome c3 family protein [Terriglobales bacterium]
MLFKTVTTILLMLTSATGWGSEGKSPAGCSGCHAEISKTYAGTSMARASGEAKDGVTTGEFTHRQSGMQYRVSVENGRVWMDFERPGDAQVKGRREFLYFIGSNKKGRTYLFSQQGFLFEAPINWYSQEGRWNMTPAYDNAKEAPMNLPAHVECMNCHASGVQAPEPGTANKYAARPFTSGGISCERCHGDGAEHAASGKGAIVNPAKLAPARRDDVCMECHFEGSVAIKQPGKNIYEFKPGQRLEDYLHYFVLADGKNDGTRALSQFEALAMSACKRKSGDKMWCGSCHDPHFSPAKQEAAEYYRGKCLSCHGAAFGERHHAENRNCVECHMPALPSGQVAHTEATDHRILKRAGAAVLLSGNTTEPTIARFPPTSEKDDA